MPNRCISRSVVGCSWIAGQRRQRSGVKLILPPTDQRTVTGCLPLNGRSWSLIQKKCSYSGLGRCKSGRDLLSVSPPTGPPTWCVRLATLARYGWVPGVDYVTGRDYCGSYTRPVTRSRLPWMLTEQTRGVLGSDVLRSCVIVYTISGQLVIYRLPIDPLASNAVYGDCRNKMLHCFPPDPADVL